MLEPLHVLVSPEFESNPDLFYKPKKNKVIECRQPDGTIKKLNTKNAKIELAELPFIKFCDKLEISGRNFEEIVREGKREIDTATIQTKIQVNFNDRKVHIGKISIKMSPVHLAVYVSFLGQKIGHCKNPTRQYCKDCIDCFPMITHLSTREAIEDIAKDYNRIYVEKSLKAHELLSKWNEGMPMERLRQYITKINKTLAAHLSDILLPFYRITSIKRYGSSSYGVNIEKSKIEIN